MDPTETVIMDTQNGPEKSGNTVDVPSWKWTAQDPASRYTKDKKIGEGTYADVYLGYQVDTGRKVAIKKIKVGQFKDGLDLSAIREVKALQELRHPNVVELIDVYSHKQNLNLVLEFLETDLEMIIKTKSIAFSAGDVKSWMKMTLQGVAFCHRNFILHRDLKPNNLLISSNGVLKLADFGLARDYGNASQKLTPNVVTRWYRSPELFFGAPYYGEGVDIWAIGCIFAELMLRTPFMAGETELGQLETIFRALGTPSEDEWPGLEDLPLFGSMNLTRYPKPPLRNLFTAAGADALDLLDRMLIYCPSRRIRAQDALQHMYFRNAPKPTHPSKLPREQTKQAKQEVAQNSLKRKVELDEANGGKRVARLLFPAQQ
ncbi:kinase-like domain-containing protein [Cladochytrium replicatum]|nr:kinase-like domain-containing protein [Cladochytrium replicatum]